MSTGTVATTLVWSFFSWLFVGFWASATSSWLIGDLTMLHWIPQLTRARWMLNPRPMQLIWAIAHVLTVIAHWFVWRDNGGWSGELGALLIGFIFVVTTVVWHGSLYWFHQIRISFWISIVMAALAISATIWFWILGVVPGVLMLFVLIWVFYISLWNFQLVRLNTVSGRVRRMGRTQTATFQQDNAGLPPPSVWSEAGRRCPYERQYMKFRQGDRVRSGQGVVRPGDAVDIFGSNSQQTQRNPTPQSACPVNSSMGSQSQTYLTDMDNGKSAIGNYSKPTTFSDYYNNKSRNGNNEDFY